MPAPTNDNWSAAELITGASGSTTGDNTDATKQVGEPIPDCGPGDGPWRTVWWQWVCPADGWYLWSTAGSRFADASELDTVLAVYEGSSLAGLTEIASNDDGDTLTGDDGLQSRLVAHFTSGTTYYVQVSGYDIDNFGSLALAWATHTPLTVPVITAPAPGTTIPVSGLGGDVVTVTWTGAIDGWRVMRTTSPDGTPDCAYVGSHIEFADTGGSYDMPLDYVTRDEYLWVELWDQTAEEWSPPSDPVLIHVAVPSSAPDACFEDDALADSPDLLWLFGDGSGEVVTDISGNGHDGAVMPAMLPLPDYYTDPGNGMWDAILYLDWGGSTVVNTSTIPISFTLDDDYDREVFIPLVGRWDSGPIEAMDVTVPAGWEVVDRSVSTDDRLTVITIKGRVAAHDSVSFNITVVGFSAAWDVSWTVMAVSSPVGLTLDASGSVFTNDMDGEYGGLVPGPTVTLPDACFLFVIAAGTGTAFLNGKNGISATQGYDGTFAYTPSFAGGSYPSQIVATAPIAFEHPDFSASFSVGGSGISAAVVVLAFTYDDPTLPSWASSALCDSGCDAAGALDFPAIPGGLVKAESTWFPWDTAGLDNWTLELVFAADASGADVIGGMPIVVDGFGFLATEAGRIAASSSSVTAAAANTDGTVNRRRAKTVPDRTGCEKHMVMVVNRDQTDDTERVRLWINGQRVTVSTPAFYSGAPDFLYDLTAFALRATDGKVSAVAFYPSSLPEHRVKAHAAHFCNPCPIGGAGFILGSTSFN